MRYGGSWHNVQSGDQSSYVTTGGGWYHVVLTFDGTNLVLYVNGDEKDTETNSSLTTNNETDAFNIGRRGDNENDNYFSGKIDDVTLWDTGLSANAVAALYNSGTGISALTDSGNYTSSDDLVFFLELQQNLNDSKNSYNFTGVNTVGNYENTDFE